MSFSLIKNKHFADFCYKKFLSSLFQSIFILSLQTRYNNKIQHEKILFWHIFPSGTVGIAPVQSRYV